ncbi:hypothetical protein FUA48_16320 [Flavobacterium alkalisoli]|uniref:DUF3592 domain-containing protein n=1 Tax=Flavobacterium alkalisoli TaxID=2602769 RepID=A0A5B9G0W7_9FLAO|nr:hypothetical protein [Flavobacterium alkalisoli]QEE51082.1 hypothetical protein FUA48_16320 [Flavobacterium alkalisoli]
MKFFKKIILTIFVLAFFYGLASIGEYYVDIKTSEEINKIKGNPAFTYAKVLKRYKYKGWNIKVEYIVDGKLYVASEEVDIFDSVKEGDSVKVEYCKGNPELMITQFNKEY